MRDPRTKNSKPENQKTKPAVAQILSTKTFNKTRKKKKKDCHNCKQEHGQKWKAEDFTPTMGVNTVNTNSDSKKRNRPDQDISQVIYWNCNQKSHYSTKYP